MKISKNDLIWLAGFFDGEGNLSIRKMKRKDSSTYIYIFMGICNTYKPVIDYIYNITGGNYYTSHKKVLSKKELYRICFDRKTIEILLKKMYPYLKIKKKQALLCLKLLESLSHKNHKRDKRGRIKKLNKHTYNYRERLLKEYNKIQREGKTVIPNKKCIRW